MDDSGGIGLVVVGPPHQGVLHHPILRMARGYLCCSLLCVAFLGARGLLLILCFNRKFTRDTARVCCCCCCYVVCCGESRSQRDLFSNSRGSHSACVVALYVRTHDQNTNSRISLGGGCSARTALARSTASCKSPGILVFCVLCSSLRVFVLVP